MLSFTIQTLKMALQQGHRYYVIHFTGIETERTMYVRPFLTLEQATTFEQQAVEARLINYDEPEGREELHDMADGVDEFSIWLETSATSPNN